jgi:ABC-type bacteriocin/lantibiotic exporter with double-glycine peptidase domain
MNMSLDNLQLDEELQFEGGATTKIDNSSKVDVDDLKVIELTPSQIEDKKQKEIEINNKAKSLLWMYIKRYKCLMIFGLLLNLLGLAGQFASPYFIGLVVDAIVLKKMDEVRFLTILWVVINTVGH